MGAGQDQCLRPNRSLHPEMQGPHRGTTDSISSTDTHKKTTLKFIHGKLVNESGDTLKFLTMNVVHNDKSLHKEDLKF